MQRNKISRLFTIDTHVTKSCDMLLTLRRRSGASALGFPRIRSRARSRGPAELFVSIINSVSMIVLQQPLPQTSLGFVANGNGLTLSRRLENDFIGRHPYDRPAIQFLALGDPQRR